DWVQRVGIQLAEADNAPGVEDKERAGADALCVTEYAILTSDQPTWLEIGQEGKADLGFTREGFMAVDVVGGDAEHLRPKAREVVTVGLIEPELLARDRFPVHGVEHQHDGIPA